MANVPEFFIKEWTFFFSVTISCLVSTFYQRYKRGTYKINSKYIFYGNQSLPGFAASSLETTGSAHTGISGRLRDTHSQVGMRFENPNWTFFFGHRLAISSWSNCSLVRLGL